MSIVEQVRNYVEEECKKPTSRYGYEPFNFHFASVVRYAEQLSDELGGDKEVIQLAGWLHDIGSILYGREEHHITGARVAGEKLKSLEYPPDRIEMVKNCILNHRGSQDNDRNNLEERIIADADAMSNFDNLPGLFKAAFVYEGKSQGEGRDSVRNKLERKWNKLHFESSRRIIKPKYEAIKVLLE
ncbi:MAG: HD domain-containing protein [archaeon]